MNERSAPEAGLGMLWGCAWRFRYRVLAAVVLLVIAKLSVVSVPLVLKRIIDGLSRPEDVFVLPVFLLLAYALLRFAGTLFGELRDLVFARVGQQTTADFTTRAFAHLLALTPRFHGQRQTGRLIRELERGTLAIGFLLGVGLFTIVPTLVEIAAVMAIMVVNYSDWFAAIISVTFALYTAFTLVFTERRQVHQRRMNELDSRANGRLVDSLLNYDAVKYFANESLEQSRFRTIMREWVEVGIRNQKALSALHVGQSAIIAAGVVSIMLLAGQAVVSGTMTVGDLVLVNAYVIQVCLPLNALGFVFRQARDATVNAEKLFALLRQRPDMEEPPSAPPLAVREAEVRFEHVSFGYEPSRQVLWDVDFRIPPGATVAVVGGSGSGKSTLARLLLRFYDVASGSVKIDGQDVRSVAVKSLRDAIGIVPQDTILFNDTIAYNIAYGRAGATLSEVVEAAKAAQLHEFILTLPEQYDTVVGERGVMLSGGEKQRIAIARAVLKNPPILIFDEATSALDPVAERLIQSELERIAQNRTTLVIAHRMSTIVHADDILVLEHGRVVERGMHHELLERRGIYARMWAIQQQQSELRHAERRLALQAVNLSAIVAAAIDGLRPEIDAKGIRLYAIVGSQSERVTGDPSLLQQLVWDLCGNAIAATPAGGRVEIEVRRNGPTVRLKVTDTGPPAKPAAGGPRLDLPRLHEAVERHDGRFSVERLPAGSGTGYIVDLPLRAVAASPEALPGPVDGPRTEEAAAAAPRLDGAFIMVVDDQDDARELLATVLGTKGAQVRSFGLGAEARRWFERTPHELWPDLLVCDIGLPDEDGYAVVRAVRALEAERHVPLPERMPAIALTGYARPEDRTQALLAGFQMHLAKPVEPRELLAGAAGLIGAKPPRRPALADRPT
jgi:ATP-binding cassette, subfamily B, bacterial